MRHINIDMDYLSVTKYLGIHIMPEINLEAYHNYSLFVSWFSWKFNDSPVGPICNVSVSGFLHEVYELRSKSITPPASEVRQNLHLLFCDIQLDLAGSKRD